MRSTALGLLVVATLVGATHQPDWTLTLRSIGPVRVGSTISEFRRAAGSSLAPGTIARDCGTAWTRDEEIYFHTAGGKLSEARVVGGNTRTPSGIGIGSSERALVNAYAGRLTDGGVEPDGGGRYWIYVPRDVDDQQFRLVFYTYEGRVESMKVGILPDVLGQAEAHRCYGEMF